MSVYADLRVKGRVLVSFDEAGVLPRLRRSAERDGLRLVVRREGSLRTMSRDQARHRPYSVALVDPAEPTTIVRPDANVTA